MGVKLCRGFVGILGMIRGLFLEWVGVLRLSGVWYFMFDSSPIHHHERETSNLMMMTSSHYCRSNNWQLKFSFIFLVN